MAEKPIPPTFPERDEWVTEHRFNPTRRWRLDYAHMKRMVAVECEGGIWTGGRHTRGYGFIADCEKYNCAVSMGWTLFRFTPSQIKNGEAAGFLRRYFEK